MPNYDLVGRELSTVLTLLFGQLKAAHELGNFDSIERVLSRMELADYTPNQKVRGLERCADDLLEFRRIMFYRVMMTNYKYESEKMAEVCGRIAEVLAQENDPARPEPLPRVDANKLDTQQFYEQFILRPHAVMLDNWGFEYQHLQLRGLVEKYGDELQPLLHTADYTPYEGPLRDTLEKDGYLANSDRLLTAHPELLDGLKAAPFQKMGRFSYMSSQLFAGNTFAGSPAHFAVAPNLFYQIEGSKRWTLVDPAFSYLTYPVLNPIDGFTALCWMDEADAERCPLYRFCPRYEVDLLPGDLLFNPRYWIHSVANATQQAVGVAVRWMEKLTPESKSPCALFDVARQLNPRRIETELKFLLALIDEKQAAWFEGHVHGRTYAYDAPGIGASFGVAAWDPTQKPRFRNPLGEQAQKLPLKPR
jgi:hypothetical protein